MNTLSHFLLGDFLQKYIKEQQGIELNWASFIYGNMLPDLKPFYKKLPHEANSWAYYIKSEITALSDHKQVSTYLGPNYSRRLGVICHFYADFFCFPHTAAFEGSSYTHMKYEWELHKFAKTYYPALYWPDFGGPIATSRNAAGIYSGFIDLQKDYLKEEQAFENDVVYTLRACIDAISLITARSLIQKAPPLGALLMGSAEG